MHTWTLSRPAASPIAGGAAVQNLGAGTLHRLLPSQEVSASDLALMWRMDELHLEHPFAGSRMLRDMLQREGHSIGRKHVAALMKKMGRAARKPNTSRRHPAHAIYPYLLRNVDIRYANHVSIHWIHRKPG